MEAAVDVLEYVNDTLFTALAVVALIRWRRQRMEPDKWFALTWVVLSAVVISLLVTPEQGGGFWIEILRKAEIAILVLFPYFLFRFMQSFVRKPEWLGAVAAVVTGAVVAGTFLLPDLGTEAESVPTPVAIWLFALLAQWTFLSLIVTVRLWTAGSGQPSVARKRMRLLSLGALGMAAALVVAGSGAARDGSLWIDLVAQVLAFVGAVSFFLGFAPPGGVRIVWRRPEADALNQAVSELMGARRAEEVSSRLLPHVVAIIGAPAAALVDREGAVIGSVGLSPDMTEEITRAAPEDLRKEMHTPSLVILPFEFGSLVVWGSAFTPFFGRDEVELVRSLGTLTGIALERAELFESEQNARLDLELANLDLEKTNEMLAGREAQLAEAQEIADIGSWDWDLGRDEVTWSDELYRIFGLKPHEFGATYQAYLGAIRPEDRDSVDALVKRAIETGEGFDHEFRIVRSSDGEVRVLHGRGRIVADGSGAPVRMIGIAQDVTERKESERALADAFSRERLARVSAERANSELESFVYTVSHDLNNPLMSIQGYLTYLDKDHGRSLPDEARFYIDRMKHSARFMQRLIKDLLELSRVGRAQTEPAPVDLNGVVYEIVGEVKATSSGVDIVVDNLPTVWMNPIRARQLFSNLIQNSVKYAGRDDVRVVVQSEENGGSGFAGVSVRDNGPGIPQEKREQVFGVFERLDTSQEGTGIGLAVCLRIVESVEGRLWIEDSDEGTDMRMTLPRPPERTRSTGSEA